MSDVRHKIQSTSEVQVIDDPEYRERRPNKCANCCRKTTKFLFSHIGLCGMVIAYSVAGGFIFQHLEKTNEQQECFKAQERYLPVLNTTLNALWEISTSFKLEEDPAAAMHEFELQLDQFRHAVLSLGYDGNNCSAMDEEHGSGFQWSFPGALLFSVTVITTIGYGNIAPKTFWGRLVCIAYATLGIPLMLLCLANIGDVMADIFRFVYTKVCCCGCCRRKDKNKVVNLPMTNDGNSPEAWKDEYNHQKNTANPKPGGHVVLDDEDDEDDDDDEKISVPLTITMGVIGGYIFMGSVLFGIWEGWTPLQAAYFCFVTISTIGFGDVVPGSAQFKERTDQWKMVGAAVYMLFGMAILSMCFSLIQEEIVAKFRWVGEKIGILERESTSEATDEEPAETETTPVDQDMAQDSSQMYSRPTDDPVASNRGMHHRAREGMPNGGTPKVKM